MADPQGSVWRASRADTAAPSRYSQPGDPMDTRTIAVLALVIAVVVLLFLIL
jgi:hypothetical protein